MSFQNDVTNTFELHCSRRHLTIDSRENSATRFRLNFGRPHSTPLPDTGILSHPAIQPTRRPSTAHRHPNQSINRQPHSQHRQYGCSRRRTRGAKPAEPRPHHHSASFNTCAHDDHQARPLPRDRRQRHHQERPQRLYPYRPSRGALHHSFGSIRKFVSTSYSITTTPRPRPRPNTTPT